MTWLLRADANPLLQPSSEREWEAQAAFNPSVVWSDGCCHMVYRAQAPSRRVQGHDLALSTIGYAASHDGIAFAGRRQLIVPELPWERFGCEDPRITRIGDRFFIFYTCLSMLPFQAAGIRVGLAITSDFRRFEKHAVTPFNAKAMALFPERIGGRLAAILTVDTDQPPAKIAIAYFDTLEQIWSEDYWGAWYRTLDAHMLPLTRSPNDHVEVGAAPVRTDAGWLLAYSYIRNYFGSDRRFTVEAALLDAAEPQRFASRGTLCLLQAEADFERRGAVPGVVFPAGAAVRNEQLQLYYGAADQYCCLASGPLQPILDALCPSPCEGFMRSSATVHGFERYAGNPILRPRPELEWEARAVFNPAALRLDGRTHLLYRAMALDGTSCLGYAATDDGVHIVERGHLPAYVPRESFEAKLRPGNSGCEDPRLTLLDGIVYLFYTAFDGYTPRVAYSTLDRDAFLQRRWNAWTPPCVVTPPGIDDKDACLLPARIDGRYVLFHRFGDCIRVNAFDHLQFGEGYWADQRSARIRPRKEYWDNLKFGIAAPPLAVEPGWLLFFHRVVKPGSIYKIEAMLLDRVDPSRVITETAATLLEPETPEERLGQTPNVVFPCGAARMGEWVYLYYGAADSVVCVARMRLAEILKRMGL